MKIIQALDSLDERMRGAVQARRRGVRRALKGLALLIAAAALGFIALTLWGAGPGWLLITNVGLLVGAASQYILARRME